MRACDLFCCAGGFTTGLVGAFEVVLGIDNDEAALRVYRANHTQSTAVNLDLRDVGGAVARIRAAGHIDLIAASPPCTDFSSAGSRQERDTVAGLTVSTARIAAALGVRIVVIENVREMVSSGCWEEAREILVRAGYSLVLLRLNSAACLVPQVRRRVFVVATRGCDEEALRSVQRQAAGLNQTPKNVPTVRSCLIKPADTYWLPSRNSPSVRSTDLPAPTLLCKCLQQPPQFYKNPHHDDAGPLAAAHVLSVQEMARVASFPSHYFDCTSRTAAGMFIGNSVCPKVAETVGRRCVQLLQSPVTPVAKPVYLHHTRRAADRMSRLQRLVEHGLMEAGGELRDGVLTYVGGVSADGDLIVKSCLGPIQAGWKIVLKLRRTPSKGRGQAPKDDLCVWMPGVQQPFRSMAQLARSAGKTPNDDANSQTL
jgi:DNA (cytosine-5)-methyltransferase 1